MHHRQSGWRASVISVVGGCFLAVELVGQLVLHLYMATYTPVAFHTRSRLRKRKEAEALGLSLSPPPARKQGRSKAALTDKENLAPAGASAATLTSRAKPRGAHEAALGEDVAQQQGGATAAAQRTRQPAASGRSRRAGAAQRARVPSSTPDDSATQLVAALEEGRSEAPPASPTYGQAPATKTAKIDDGSSNSSSSRSSSRSPSDATALAQTISDGAECGLSQTAMDSVSPANGEAATQATPPEASSHCDAEADAAADGTEAPVVVLMHEELTALEDTDASLELIRSGVGSEDWAAQYEATTAIRRLVQFHPQLARSSIYAQLEPVLGLLKTGVESLRSAQNRNALYAIGELFRNLPDKDIIAEASSPIGIDGVVDAVVLKSVNDKRFIASAGEAVIQQMVESAPCPALLLSLLRHASSKNPKVCTVIARHGCKCLRGIVDAAATEEHKSALSCGDETEAQALISGFAELELSRSVDAKKPAQAALRLLFRTLKPEPFEAALKTALNPTSVAHVLEIVRKPAVKKGPAKPSRSLREIMAEKRREMARSTSSS